MKNRILFLLLLIATVTSAQQSYTSVDDDRKELSRFQLGFQLSKVNPDFGIGLNLTSPRFFQKHVSIRLSGNVQWLQYISSSTSETTWSPYGSYKLGVNGISGHITKSIFVYGEWGLVLITPNKTFSNKSLISGGYGLFGFEFMITKGLSYYIELGGMGTGAIAEKSLFKTTYSNGFTTSVGIRISL